MSNRFEKLVAIGEKQRTRDRNKRVSVGGGDRLVADSREGFRRRYVNDLEGRVERFVMAGWTPVIDKDDDMFTGDKRAGDSEGLGSVVQRSVGNGTNGVLMEIPNDLYDEYQKEKQDEIDEREKALLQNVPKHDPGADGTYGKIEISR